MEITIEEDEILVYFYVKSLFTSVPLREAIEQVGTVLEQNHHMLGKLSALDKYEIISLLKLCTEAAFFKF